MAAEDRPAADEHGAAPPSRRSVFPGFADIERGRRTLAADLSALRRQRGLSQTDLAARMGTSQSAVARIEAGEVDVRLSTLQRYADALGARLSWGLHWDAGDPGGDTGADDRSAPERPAGGVPASTEVRP